jgi:rubredoxin
VIGGEGGLSARAIVLAPGQEAVAGDPSATPCQYILVTAGTLRHEGQERGALTVIHVPPTDAPFRLVAGPAGLECLVLDFPRAGATAQPATQTQQDPAHEPGAWHCELCGFVYDAAEGLPAQGIAPGTPWSAIPADFQCPDCAATKHDFVPVEF